MEQIRCPETSLINYQHNDSETLSFVVVTESSLHPVYEVYSVYTYYDRATNILFAPSKFFYLATDMAITVIKDTSEKTCAAHK